MAAKKYDDSVFMEILEEHSKGKTITAVLREMPNAPDISRVLRRCAENPVLSQALARASRLWCDVKADEAEQIAADLNENIPMMDTGKLDSAGKPIMKVDLMAQKSRCATARVRIDTILRVIAMVNPAKYGAKIDMTVRDEAPTLESLPDSEVNARIARLMRARGIPEQYVQMMMIPELPPVGLVIDNQPAAAPAQIESQGREP